MIVIGGWGYSNQKPITIMKIGAGGQQGGMEIGAENSGG
jgi:hypothetical protein